MEAKGIRIERLNSDNFGPCSLDRFVRTQPVTEVWRRSPEGYRLVRQPFVDDWSPERKREKACGLLSPGCTVYGAFSEERVVGFVQLNDALNGGRMIVESLHVSREFRHRGLGRALFERALGEARARGSALRWKKSTPAHSPAQATRRTPPPPARAGQPDGTR